MNTVTLLLIFIPIVVSLWVCHVVAKKKGLNQGYWRLMAIMFGPFALPFVFLAKAKKPTADEDSQQDK